MTPLTDADKYLVTTTGEVWAKERRQLLEGRHPTPYWRTYPAKQLATVVGNTGYKQVGMTIYGKQVVRTVHRLVALTHLPNPNNLPEVNHKDGNRLNNDVSNLEWTTRSGNAKHAADYLNMRGSHVGTAKLTENDVLEIVRLSSLNMTQTQLAKKFGVTNHAVHRIVHGYNWSWLTKIRRKEGEQ